MFPFTWLSATWMGVNLFFVDSGFVLYLPFALGRRQISSLADFKRAYARRAWRLLPLYYVMLVVALVLDAALLHHVKSPAFEIPAYLTFTFPFFRETWQPRPNGTLWSIGVEVWFSLAFPFLVILVKRIGMVRLVALAFVIALVTRWLAYGCGFGTQMTKTLNTLADSLPGRIDNFALGMAAAAIFAHARTTAAFPRPSLLAAIGIALFSASAWLYDADLAFGQLSPAVAVGAYALANVGFFAFVLGALRSEGLLRRVLTFPPLRVAGIGCYSLYLVHAPLAWVLYLLEGEAPSTALRASLTAGYLLAVALTSYVTYQTIEKPGILRGQRANAGGTPQSQPASSGDLPSRALVANSDAQCDSKGEARPRSHP